MCWTMNNMEDANLVYINIHGLRNKTPSDVFNEIKCYNPSVLILGETHVTDCIDDSELKMENYDEINVTSNSAHTGGLLCYVRRGIDYKVLDIVKNPYALWAVTMEIKIGKERQLLTVLHRSPSSPIRVGFDYLEVLTHKILGRQIHESQRYW